ncbi:MAG: ADP-ribosylglycohydrolase family protein [Treponema sp.]|nr:ADP-ribosylglycohydrolase family protein [Treponema sp.]
MSSMMKTEYLNRIYAGWLAKIIGIRLGAPIEGWTYEKIKNVYGELDHYPVDYKDFAADDDSNGPIFFLRALEDGKDKFDLSAQAVGEALLNYAPFEHGFFWWGGYGISTEHTAYLNLRNGIEAPRSGSVEQNGRTVAEQIGGQIFIDTWGLVCPGNPDLAAKYAQKAASVTHGGNGVYGGIFIAACIAYAFEEHDIKKIINKGLSYIPSDSEYTKAVKAVIGFYDKNPGDWRECFRYIFENFGYDKYPGNCHIIPNIAVMILGLLYGESDFSRTITITNMCGWDTDCNVGNVAAIMGVVCGLEGIDYQKWRKPINDFLTCSSVIGSLNIMDIPYGASYIAKLAWEIAEEELPVPYGDIIRNRIDSCHFEFPGSTHAIRIRTEHSSNTPEIEIMNTDETAHSGKRSLKIHVMPMHPANRTYIYKKTHYTSKDYHDSRYDPCFSPLLYPGQIVHGSIFVPDYGNDCEARLYVHNADNDSIIEGEKTVLKKGEWAELSLHIPHIEAGLIDEAGFAVDMAGPQKSSMDLTCMIDDLYFDGKADYSVDLAKVKEDTWTGLHREIMQFTRLKGLWYLEGDCAHLSCTDFGEVYTGRYDWTNYRAVFAIQPCAGNGHFVNVRVQGAIRSYAVGFTADKLGLYKNENGYRKLAETDFSWELGKTYDLNVTAEGPHIEIKVTNKQISYTDNDAPYLKGCIGMSVRNNSHCAYRMIKVQVY